MTTPTLHDVAALAGVSYATADRVLNRRGNVAEKSVRKVTAAMQQLGYVRNIAAANLSKSRQYRLAFVMPRRENAFFARMHNQLDKAALHLKSARVEINVIEIAAFDAAALSDALAGLAADPYDGIAVVGVGLRDAPEPLLRLRNAGTKIVSLVSDLPEDSRDHYIGIDNDKAGRTAARLIGMAHTGRPGGAGRVLLATGSPEARDHADRLAGARAVLSADYPGLEVAAVVETRDQPDRMRRVLTDAVTPNAGITAIYNVGAGNDGLIEALQAMDLPQKPFCVVHELSRRTAAAVEAGWIDGVLDQRPEIEMTRALALLRAIVDDLPPPPAPELIPAIYLRDNLPADPL